MQDSISRDVSCNLLHIPSTPWGIERTLRALVNLGNGQNPMVRHSRHVLWAVLCIFHVQEKTSPMAASTNLNFQDTKNQGVCDERSDRGM